MIRTSLRTKILLSVGLIIFIVLGTSTLVHIRDLKRDYLEAIEWRSEALAQGILIQATIQQENTEYGVTSVQVFFDALSKYCLRMYDMYKLKDVTHIALIDQYGQIITQSNTALHNTSLENRKLLGYIETRVQVTALVGNVYHTLVPVFLAENVYIGSIDIGFPKSVVDEKVAEVLLHAFFIFALFLMISLFLISILMSMLLTRPVKYLVMLGRHLSEGRLIFTVKTNGRHDEIGSLGLTFNSISTYFQEMADIASKIATGNLVEEFSLRSEYDVLGNAFRDMLDSLRDTANLMLRIADGDLTETVPLRSESDAFGMVMQAMTEGLRKLIVQIQTSAEQITATGMTISSLADNDIRIVQDVNASMQTMMATISQTGTSVEEVAANVDILSSSVEETSASVAKMTVSIADIAMNTNALNEQSHEATNSLGEAMRKLKEVVQSTEISRQLSQKSIQDSLAGQQAVEEVMESMDTISQTIRAGVETITRFAERSGEIDTILDVIRDITGQTSLLALNASIIAAQAGEHGRGFAVVANEIKELANGVEASTRDIAVIVGTLQEDTQRIVQTIHNGADHVQQGVTQTEQARHALEQILSSARRSSSLVADIAEALQSLMNAGHEATCAMQAVDSMADGIRLATNAQTSSTQQINQAIEHITRMAFQIQQATVEQIGGVRQMLEAAYHVNGESKQNLESSQHIVETTKILATESEMLLNSVDRFKLNA